MSQVQRPSAAAAWLPGTWRSNRRKTVAGWIWPPGKKGAACRRIMEPAFGKLTFRYTKKRVYWRFDTPKFSYTPYRIVWSNSDTVFLVSGEKASESGLLLHFVSKDEFWVHAGRGIEWFRRRAGA